MKIEIDTEDPELMRKLTASIIGDLKSIGFIPLLSNADRMAPVNTALKRALEELTL